MQLTNNKYNGQMAKMTTFLQAHNNCDMRGIVAIQAEKDRLRVAAQQAEAERIRQVNVNIKKK